MTRLIDRISPRRIAIPLAAFAGGAIAASLIAGTHQPTPALAAIAPQSIASASQSNGLFAARQIVSLKGEVTGIYGDTFTLKDATGQTLVHSGHTSTGLFGQQPLVATGQTVTVQGFAHDNAVRALFIITADGKAWMVGGRGGGADHDRRGGKHGHGHDRDYAVPPKADGPASAPVTAPAPAPAPQAK